jgi:hypothetical protein
MGPKIEQEMTELAASRAAATDKPVAVIAFVSSGRMTVLDLDLVDDELTAIEQGTVPMLHPTEPEAA